MLRLKIIVFSLEFPLDLASWSFCHRATAAVWGTGPSEARLEAGPHPEAGALPGWGGAARGRDGGSGTVVAVQTERSGQSAGKFRSQLTFTSALTFTITL